MQTLNAAFHLRVCIHTSVYVGNTSSAEEVHACIYYTSGRIMTEEIQVI